MFDPRAQTCSGTQSKTAPKSKHRRILFAIFAIAHAFIGVVSARPALPDFERLSHLDVVFVDTGISYAHKGALDAPANTFVTGDHGEIVAQAFEDELKKLSPPEAARGVQSVWHPGGTKENPDDLFLSALSWSIALKPRVLNLSMSQNGITRFEFALLQTACDNDIVVVAAAGNRRWYKDGATEYPAALKLPCIVAVGTLDDGRPRDSSSRGRAWLEKSDKDPAGTSFSCARMSAIAVWYRQLHPQASAADVKKYLETKYALPRPKPRLLPAR
jgi:subtilisin family serine protease